MKTSAVSVAYQRDLFFAAVRKAFGALSNKQVVGFEAILAEAERRTLDVRFTSYMLATPWWETGRAMAAVPEDGRGRGHDYGKPDPVTGKTYYGRGLVQITHKANYAKMSAFVGVDLVANPDRALDLPIAVTIMFEGMLRGSFTGKKLADYFHGDVSDWTGARRIINGTDHASEIATFGRSFLGILMGCASDGPSSISAPAKVAAKPAPAPAAAASAHPQAAVKATIMATAPTSNNPLAAAHPKVAAALPGVDLLAGIENLGKNIVAQLEAGAKAISNPAIPSVTGKPGSTNFFGTLENVKSAASKVGEIIADAKSKDVREAFADGADLLKIIFATLDTFKVNVPVLSTVVASLPDLHAPKTA